MSKRLDDASIAVLDSLPAEALLYVLSGDTDFSIKLAGLRASLAVVIPDLVADGVTDDTAALQAEIDRLAAIPADTEHGNRYNIVLPGMCAVSDQIVVPDTLDGLWISHGGLKAVTGLAWDPTLPLLEWNGARGGMLNVMFECNRLCAGPVNLGSTNTFIGVRAARYYNHAFKEDGSGGGTYWINARGSQWYAADPEFASDVDWTSKGLHIVNGDCKYIAPQFSQNGGGNLYIEFPAQSSQVLGGHLFNGRSSGSPSVDMVNIYYGAAVGGFSFENMYLDNGRILLYSDSVAFYNCFGLKNANITLSEWAVLYGQAGRSHPDRFVWKGWKFSGSALTTGTLQQLQVLPNPDDASTYAGDWTNLAPVGTCPDLDISDAQVKHVARNTADEVLELRHTRSGDSGIGARLGFRDASTDDTDGLPAIGSRGNRLALYTQEAEGVQIISSLTGAGGGSRIEFSDADTTNKPSLRTVGNDFLVRATTVTLSTITGDAQVELSDANGFLPHQADTMNLGSTARLWKEAHIKTPLFQPGGVAPALTDNGQITFALTANTTITFKARGSDGVTRTGTITLS